MIIQLSQSLVMWLVVIKVLIKVGSVGGKMSSRRECNFSSVECSNAMHVIFSPRMGWQVVKQPERPRLTGNRACKTAGSEWQSMQSIFIIQLAVAVSIKEHY